MNILEKEIEDIVYECAVNERELLSDRGLNIHAREKVRRQVCLGDYGIADMIGIWIFENSIHITIYELKKDQVNTSTFLQAIRYCKAVKQIIEQHGHWWLSFDIVLIGKSIDLSSEFAYLPDIINTLRVYTYSIDIVKGLKFKRQSGYHLSDEKIPVLNFSISDLKKFMHG